MDRDIYLPVRFDQPPYLFPRHAAQATDNHEDRTNRGSLYARGFRAWPRVYAPQREREPGRAGPEYPCWVGQGSHKSLQVSIALRIGDDALTIVQGSTDDLMVSEILDAQRADRRELMGEQAREVGLPNGGVGIIRHLGLVDGDAMDALDATNRGTPGGRKGRRNDDTISTRTTQRRCELYGDVPPQGGVKLLEDNACHSGDMCGIHNALRGETCWHGAGIGIENYSVEVIFDYLRRAEIHGGPVTGVDELDAGISGAGNVVSNDSYQHFSLSGLMTRKDSH
jgi:hypothetical protein